MNRYLLDTNHLSHAMRRVSTLRDRIGQQRLQGDKFGTCVPALCELEVGIQQTGFVEENHRRLRGLMKGVAVWPVELAAAPLYAQYYMSLRARGRVLDPVDLLVAVVATLQNAVVLTADQDFTGLPEVRTENWLT
jgi:predicted nucleic acid-binding protein